MVQRYLLVVLLAAAPVFADESGEAKQSPKQKEIVDFLKDSIIGKKFVSPPRVVTVGGGKVEADVKKTVVSFDNLQVAPDGSGFSLDQITEREQVNYDLDSAGKRTGEGKDVSKTTVLNYRLSSRRSTGEVTGIFTLKDIFGWEYGVRANLDGKKLTLATSSVLYSDGYAQDGAFRPAIAEIDYILDASGAETTLASEERGFEANPETLERSNPDKPIKVQYKAQ